MNRIRLLSEQVANQIAAGEVVERPASVVKELVENALDAQATHIHVDIQAGGRSLIRVTDNGLGMSRDDALLCFERHATSKITSAGDLQKIATMGFRGEALPSIASVGRITLTTRDQDPATVAATQIIINGGKLVDVKAAGAPPGTALEVRQLFFNLPARRKFLRSEETERAHIQQYLTLAALAFPEVAFTFTQDQRLLWQLPALKIGAAATGRLAALRERLRLLYGSEQALIALDFSTTLEAPRDAETAEPNPVILRVWGYIGSPGVSRATRENHHLFVNRRPIENRGLNFALLEGYHTALMKGRYPVCCLFLEIDPAEVDVNIHPAKREVKFHREKAVRLGVAQAVRQALLGFHVEPARDAGPATRTETATSARGPAPARPLAPALEPKAPEPLSLPGLSKPAPAAQPLNRGAEPRSALDPSSRPSSPRESGSERSLPATVPPLCAASPAAAMPVAPDRPSPHPVQTPPAISSSPLPPTGSEATPLLAVPMRLIGVIGHLYALLESDRGLVLLDQHAAHERVLFEQMLRRLEQDQVASQRLLLPETIELSPREAQFLREQLATLNRLGIGLSEFGERTFLLDAVPPFVQGGDRRRFVLDILDELKASGQGVNPFRVGEPVVAKTVCRHAVKAHDPLTLDELANLLDDLRQCAMPYTCPHGRPTLIEIGFRELEKKFGRTQ